MLFNKNKSKNKGKIPFVLALFYLNSYSFVTFRISDNTSTQHLLFVAIFCFVLLLFYLLRNKGRQIEASRHDNI